jgi:hypothetical protein
MTRQHFIQLLRDYNIDESRVSFGPEFHDGYCIRKNHLRWEVYVQERGKAYNLMGFPSESDALRYLCEILLSVHGVAIDGTLNKEKEL